MIDKLVDVPIGVVAGIVGLLLVQSFLVRHRWSTQISWAVGDVSGHPVFQVKLARPRRRFLKRVRRILRKRRIISSPIDVSFYARVALTIDGVEHVVAVPVTKQWRPIIARAVYVTLRPERCDPEELWPFPPEIQRRRTDGDLTVQHLLACDNTSLRVYAFAYRPRLGTRWMRRESYKAADITPGRFEPGGIRVISPDDGLPPRRREPHLGPPPP